jgi:hypothetical protein
MSASRFGPRVALASNPFASFFAAGRTLTFGLRLDGDADGTVGRCHCGHRSPRRLGIDLPSVVRAATLGGKYVVH